MVIEGQNVGWCTDVGSVTQGNTRKVCIMLWSPIRLDYARAPVTRVRVNLWIDIGNYERCLCLGLITCLGVIVYWGTDKARVLTDDVALRHTAQSKVQSRIRLD